MAGNAGVTTRLQSRRTRDMTGRQGNGNKRRTKETLVGIEEENADCSTLQYSRRSFPLQRENDHNMTETKKTSKTESFAKQKRTLSEIGENVEKLQNADHRNQQQSRKTGKSKSTHSKHRSAADGFLLVKDLEYFKATTDAISVLPMETEVYTMDAGFSYITSSVPVGVEDIDSKPDSLTTTQYSQDIIKYLMYLESRHPLKNDFLDTSPAITTKMRGLLMDWLIQVQSHEELKDETLHLCVDLIDRFLSLVNVDMSKLQLVGISSLLVASKFNERFAPEISTLCYLTDNTFVKEEVLHYEKLILHKLKFDLSKPVCITFLDRFLQVHKHSVEIEYLAKYLLDLTIMYAHLMPVLPSLKAAAALFMARQLLMDSVPPWTRGLHYYTGYSQSSLQEVADELSSLLLKVRSSKNQGARNKYNTEQYSYISAHSRVDIDWNPVVILQHMERDATQSLQ
ncbi:G2/mitotic-specific cyclin-B [Bulinus truncatus]|nr:G2/mitotic-specific cyclin-B [Bulinus truncatus]